MIGASRLNTIDTKFWRITCLTRFSVVASTQITLAGTRIARVAAAAAADTCNVYVNLSGRCPVIINGNESAFTTIAAFSAVAAFSALSLISRLRRITSGRGISAGTARTARTARSSFSAFLSVSAADQESSVICD
jgi:hypothetical protein